MREDLFVQPRQRKFRKLEIGSIWEGRGQRQVLDVIRREKRTAYYVIFRKLETGVTKQTTLEGWCKWSLRNKAKRIDKRK